MTAVRGCCANCNLPIRRAIGAPDDDDDWVHLDSGYVYCLPAHRLAGLYLPESLHGSAAVPVTDTHVEIQLMIHAAVHHGC